jgi:hypothetical protein
VAPYSFAEKNGYKIQKNSVVDSIVTLDKNNSTAMCS